MSSWKSDKSWSDQFIPEVKSILGRELIMTATWKQDALEGSDLTVLALDAMRVAVRIRRWSYIQFYGDQFTIRSGRPSENETELAKIMSGWGNYLFYGFSDAQECNPLARWFLGDLNHFRLTLWREKGLLTDRFKHVNGDGSSWFYSWPVRLFGDRFFIAQGGLQ